MVKTNMNKAMTYTVGAFVALCAFAPAISGCIPRQPGGGGAGADASTGVANLPDAKACPADGLLDDGEDNNNQIALHKGRGGYWYTFADQAGSTITPQAGALGGTFSMSPGGANGSQSAARMNGKIGGSGTVFAGMGFNFVDPKAPADISQYKGISFWAKRGENSAGAVRVKLPDVNTDPEGKVCTECFNDFGMDIQLTTTWTQYFVLFGAAQQQAGWGQPRPGAPERAKMFGVQWQVNTPGADYDIYIDDVQFTGCP
ncbi:hypothetical protein [Polyangium fumosum]|uniref:CBM11 domain-containing protein n=1 Tax=Polyangium fumosum TaxID=889272 RepID=A0A4U1IEU8_9BACT|nr:hypothetical protein [Polyangium fumosum]TKC92085.1 hypothetical protein E8A74_50520 [Polyangium fumosum]